MGEVTSAVYRNFGRLDRGICTGVILPGTTGILYRQFALTIAFSIAISAFNALTLSPALSPSFCVARERTMDCLRPSSAASRECRPAMPAYSRGAALALSADSFVRRWPGCDRVHVPDCTYIVRCRRKIRATLFCRSRHLLELLCRIPTILANQAQAIVMHEPEVDSSFAVTGFSFAGSAANYGLVFVSLKPFSQRKGADHSAGALVVALARKTFLDSGWPCHSVRAACDSGHRQFWRISV